MRIASILSVILLAMPVLTPTATQARQGDVPTLPAIGSAVPDFTLADAHTGTKRQLSEFAVAHRPVALFFFCGCSACHAVATEWATFQHGNALPANAATVIVYATTDRAEATARVRASGLDSKRTAVLCDTEDLFVTERLYRAEPCPRLVVVDPAGKVVYLNTPGDGERGKPQQTPSALLAARALSALQSTVQPPKEGVKP